MSVQIIKADIKRKLIRNGIIIAVLTVLLIGSYLFASKSSQKLSDGIAKVNSLKSQIEKMKNEYEQSEAGLKEYMAIDKMRLPSEDGYVLARDRLKVVVPAVQSLKDTYVFKKLNLSMTEIKENSDARSSQFGAYENSIQLDFAGATDEYIFSFINDVKNMLPGYVYVNTLEIKRDQEITIASAIDYLSNNNAAFVSGTMELNWVTLRNGNAPLKPTLRSMESPNSQKSPQKPRSSGKKK